MLFLGSRTLGDVQRPFESPGRIGGGGEGTSSPCNVIILNVAFISFLQEQKALILYTKGKKLHRMAFFFFFPYSGNFGCPGNAHEDQGAE